MVWKSFSVLKPGDNLEILIPPYSLEGFIPPFQVVNQMYYNHIHGPPNWNRPQASIYSTYRYLIWLHVPLLSNNEGFTFQNESENFKFEEKTTDKFFPQLVSFR